MVLGHRGAGFGCLVDADVAAVFVQARFRVLRSCFGIQDRILEQMDIAEQVGLECQPPGMAATPWVCAREPTKGSPESEDQATLLGSGVPVRTGVPMAQVYGRGASACSSRLWGQTLRCGIPLELQSGT